MKTLLEHNTEAIIKYRNQYGLDVSCDNCGAELIKEDDKVLLTFPPKINVICPRCNYKSMMTI